MSDEAKPATLGEVLGNAGGCPEITWNGKVWKIPQVTLGARRKLEILAAGKACENVEELRDSLSPEAFARREAALDAAIHGGSYKTWAAGWRAVTGGPDGDKLFLLACLREHYPAVTEADVVGMTRDVPNQVRAVIRQVFPLFFELLVDHPEVPPERRPGLLEEMRTQLAEQLARKEAILSPTSLSN